MEWVVALWIPDDVVDDDWTVVNDSEEIDEDDNGFWVLADPLGTVEANADATGQSLHFDEAPFRLFKLVRSGAGTFTTSLKRGQYVLIAERDWKPDLWNVGAEELQEPEDLRAGQYIAYHLRVDASKGASPLRLRSAEESSQQVAVAQPSFELAGTVLQDDHPYAGPLFGASPPELRTVVVNEDRGYKQVVVRKEGETLTGPRWRQSAVDFSELREHIASRGIGWYAVRIYDNNDHLIETLDFRFAPQLCGLSWSDLDPLPGETGHAPVRISLQHETGAVDVHPHSDNHCNGYELRTVASGTEVVVPTIRECDQTSWEIRQGDRRVDLYLTAERVWWAVVAEDSDRSDVEWNDRPLAVDLASVRATSTEWLIVSVPQKWKNAGLSVGPEATRSEKLRRVRGTSCHDVRLGQLGRYVDETEPGAVTLLLWIRPSSLREQRSTPIAQVQIRGHCHWCEFSSTDEQLLIGHVLDSHTSEHFRRLTYEEVRNRHPTLPKWIYRCDYCDYYCYSHDRSVAVGDVCRHIERDCPQAPRDGGLVHVSFRIIKDVDEIRKNVFGQIPKVHVCRSCGFEVNQDDLESKRDHLRTEHSDELFEVH